MKTSFVFMVVSVLLAIFMAGCAVPGAPTPTPSPTTQPPDSTVATGTIEVRITDAPPEYNVTSINVTVSEPEGVKARRAVDGDEEEWELIDIIEGNNPFDLTQLEGGLQQVLAMATVPAGNYTQIRMNIETVEVTYTYVEDGVTENYTVQAKLPSGKLKFVRPFEVVEGETTVLLFDFIADKSVVFTGAADKVIFKPVIKLSIEQGGKPHQLASVDGTISAIDTEAHTVSILPNGETEDIVVDVNPQKTEITLDGDKVSLSDLAGVVEEKGVNTVNATASYYLNNLKAVTIDAESPPEEP